MDQELLPSTQPKLRNGDPMGCYVALAIFATLLCAIMIPIFRSAREEAVDVSCLSNMRELGEAFSQYEQDNNFRLPPAHVWATCIEPHLSGSTTEKLSHYHCPAATKTPYGYAFNQVIGGRSSESMSDPPSVVMLFESDAPNFDAIGSSADIAWKRHYVNINFLYADGHARKLLNNPQLWDDYEKRAFKWK